MNELFPIIRRKRRPLILEDAPPVVVGNVEPVKADAVSDCPAPDRAAPAADNPGCIAASASPTAVPS